MERPSSTEIGWPLKPKITRLETEGRQAQRRIPKQQEERMIWLRRWMEMNRGNRRSTGRIRGEACVQQWALSADTIMMMMILF